MSESDNKEFTQLIPRFSSRNDAHLSAENKITRARMILFEFVPFFGTLIARSEIKVVPAAQTLAGTAQVDIWGKITFADTWIKDLTSDEVIGVMCHEILHAAMDCIPRQKIYNKIVVSLDDNGIPRPVPLFNLAHDFFVNLTIIEAIEAGQANTHCVNLPKVGLFHRKYAGMAAEEIYNLLDADIAENDPIPFPGFASDLDTEGDDGDGTGDGDGDGEGDSEKDGNGGKRKVSPQAIKEAREQWKQALIDAVSQNDRAGKPPGCVPSSIRKYVHELLNPRVYWKDIVSRWLGEHGANSLRTYMRPGRRSNAVGITLKHGKPSDISDICVLMDTSGSMGGREQEIVSEVIGIAEDLGLSLRVVAIDCTIHDDVSDVTSVDDINFVGGGGSDLRPIFQRLEEERYDGLVLAFTDGYIGVPATMPPTLKGMLWVLWKEHHDIQPAPWGEAVLIEKDGFTHKEQGMFKHG